MKQQTFIAVINPVQDKMYRLALRLLVSKEAAEDAVQEVLLKLWDRKKKLKEYQNVEAFAMTVTKNHCLDQLKLKQNNNLRIVHSNYEDHNPSVERQVEGRDELSRVEEMIETLPEQQKIILQLRDIEHYEYEEIAKITGMNEAAIRVALSRARKKIREDLIKRHRYGLETS